MAVDDAKSAGWAIVWASASVGLLLLASSTVHRLGLGTPGYARSPLVSIELALMVLLFLILLAQPALAIVHLVRRRPRGLIVVAVATGISLVALMAAMIIDGATLLHAT
jgi:hypothetical protein